MVKMMGNYNKLLFILPFYNRENWTADYQVQTVNELSKKYPVVVYYECNKTYLRDLIRFKKPRSFLYKQKGVYYYSQIDFIPFIRFSLVKKLNALINTVLLFLFLHTNPFSKKIIIWGFHPEVADFEKNFPFPKFSVFDCVDYFSSTIPEHNKIIEKQEKYIMEKFDLVTVNSQTLYFLHKRERKQIAIVPLGFTPPSKKLTKKIHVPQSRPIIGFVGAMNYRLDYKLLQKLAEGKKQWTFIFWGPRQEDIQDKKFQVDEAVKYLFSLPNVIHGESVNRDETYAVTQQFNVCIIPYNTQLDFNKYCFPMKLFEYFYMGKPVLSTPINELKYYSKFVRIGSKAEDWERYIRELLEKPWPEEFKSEQKRIALVNAWDKKISTILNSLYLDKS